jgi:steroid 5-alpha reductase family enzyme
MEDLAIWLDGIYLPVLRTCLVLAILTFVALFFIAAPYGRFTRTGWGPRINAMWGWIIMEFPAVAALPVYFIVSGAQLTILSAVFATMWLAHYVNRTFVYPVRRRDPASVMPLVVVGLAIVFNLINGFANGWFVFFRMSHDVAWLADPRFIAGVAVFVLGMVINMHSDRVLLRLKRQGKGYQVPHEGLHRYVAAPNYLGEILQWAGWALATWSFAGVLFAIYTFANLAPRARSNLKWYHEEFADYPEERKALIPGVW